MNCKFLLALVLAAAPWLAAAQASQLPGLSAAMTKFFGDNQAFSATATATILEADGKHSMTVPMSYTLLDGKIRSEVDMAQVKSRLLEVTAAGLKQMGMDRIISIVRPDQQKVFQIYPSLRAYAESAITNAGQSYKIDSVSLGKESLDGRPCEKKKLTVSSTDGEKQEAIVWNATDLKNFPVKMEIKHETGRTIMTYTNLKFDKPDVKLFDPPGGFDKYDSIEKMMQAAIMKMLGTIPQR